MIRRLVIFLVRKKLGLKNNEKFRFVNQKSIDDYYFFYDTVLMKYDSKVKAFIQSSVSLNWLLDDDCEISKIA